MVLISTKVLDVPIITRCTVCGKICIFHVF